MKVNYLTVLNTIYEWYKTNSMSINIDKTVFVGFKKSNFPEYIIDDRATTKVDAVNLKDLGIIVDHKLSFKGHCFKTLTISHIMCYKFLNFAIQS